MKIGFCVEGATDRALVMGLGKRWCPYAQFVEGRFRGTTDLSLRREIPQICRELNTKDCQVIVFLTDSNEQQWRDVKRRQLERVPEDHRHFVLVAVAERNVECWFCADADWIAGQTQREPAEFRAEDPKGVFEAALKISSTQKQEPRLQNLAETAPLKSWLKLSPSFEDFYDQAWDMSKAISCQIPNERE